MITIEKLLALKSALADVGVSPTPLADEVLHKMAVLWRTQFLGFSNRVPEISESVRELIRYKNHSHACGCLGPRDGWDVCDCTLWHNMETYSISIAIYMLQNHSEMETVDDMIALRKSVGILFNHE